MWPRANDCNHLALQVLPNDMSNLDNNEVCTGCGVVPIAWPIHAAEFANTPTTAQEKAEYKEAQTKHWREAKGLPDLHNVFLRTDR